jgi:hypothetical protein
VVLICFNLLIVPLSSDLLLFSAILKITMLKTPTQNLLLAFSGTSFVSGLALIFFPHFAWTNFFHVSYHQHHDIENDSPLLLQEDVTNSYVSVLYGASLLGEGSLQLAAGFFNIHYVNACLIFMIPYKLASVIGLGIQAWRGKISKQNAMILGFQWFAPLVLLRMVRDIKPQQR